mmetsp:Transcript_26707/g.39680  ORF Transcript_26707/g.39680 Transcript_26707/m.39680 type:complete len:97 (-) Transcript_26707:3046-3336(-)
MQKNIKKKFTSWRKKPTCLWVVQKRKKAGSKLVLLGINMYRKKPNKQTKILCLSPEIIEYDLPRLLLHAYCASLVFMGKKVLARDQATLNTLVWEF